MVLLELSRDEIFNRLTENGKYTGVYENEYKGMYLGTGFYIASGNLKMEHSKPTESVYDSGEKYDVKG